MDYEKHIMPVLLEQVEELGEMENCLQCHISLISQASGNISDFMEEAGLYRNGISGYLGETDQSMP